MRVRKQELMGRFGRATYNAESAVNILVDGRLSFMV